MDHTAGLNDRSLAAILLRLPSPVNGVLIGEILSPTFFTSNPEPPGLSGVVSRCINFSLDSLPDVERWALADTRDGILLFCASFSAHDRLQIPSHFVVCDPVTGRSVLIGDAPLHESAYLGASLLLTDGRLSFEVIVVTYFMWGPRLLVFSSHSGGWTVHPYADVGGRSIMTMLGSVGYDMHANGCVYWVINDEEHEASEYLMALDTRVKPLSPQSKIELPLRFSCTRPLGCFSRKRTNFSLKPLTPLTPAVRSPRLSAADSGHHPPPVPCPDLARLLPAEQIPFARLLLFLLACCCSYRSSCPPAAVPACRHWLADPVRLLLLLPAGAEGAGPQIPSATLLLFLQIPCWLPPGVAVEKKVLLLRRIVQEQEQVAMLGLDYMASSSMNKKKITTTIPRMTGIQWVELQLQDSMECFNMFRMRRSVFLSLHDTLVQDYGLRSSRQFCSKEALGMFLWACGAPQSSRQCKNNFCRSLETVSRKFEEVLESIMRLAVDIVRPKDPQFSTVHPKLQEARF
ncbi:uncharacterized protein LOC101767513 [Setaria italica]|uniref:uncharacterized protein LOC101767513 n=1 Tax=Setaria italica TaxID=4555 RepID=UPI000BE4CB3E|nr:uncharacterized protein LOC101767513 [Setaria italica]